MIKKIYLLFFIFIFIVSVANAQIMYGNEWIVPTQQYYKLSTAQDGIYGVSYADLNAAGVNMSINPQRFQLWHRGVEQNILIKGELDGIFNNSDSLYFYGKRNDGTLDAKIYQPSILQPHKYYNLYSDTTAYFLTWGTVNSTKRMTTDLSNTVLTPEPFHLTSSLIVYSDDYTTGHEGEEARQTYGENGETWCGYRFDGVSVTKTISLSNVSTSGNFTVEVMVVGRNHSNNRNVTLKVDNLPVENFPGFSQLSTSLISRTYASSVLGASSVDITITPINVAGQIKNDISIAYIKIIYPQSTNMGGATQKIFSPVAAVAPSYFDINWTSSSSPLIFDLTDKNNLRVLNSTLASSSLGVFVPAGVTEFITVESNACLKVPVLKEVNLIPYDTTSSFLILTSKKLWTKATDYATYRASNSGGNHQVLMVDVEKLYNQFSYGEYTPIGIKQFCDYQVLHNEKIENLFIIGKGMDVNYGSREADVFYRKNSSNYINNPILANRIENFVPPYGSPPSDMFYALKFDNTKNKYMPGMAVGRLSAKTENDIQLYLDKVIAHEKLDSNLLWRKHLVHISGGNGVSQQGTFRGYVEGYRAIVENSTFKGKVVRTISKTINSETILDAKIADYVNNGLNMVTFFGHSAYFVTEVDIGKPSSEIYGFENGSNKNDPSDPSYPRYPFMFLNGCESAAVYYKNSLAEDWINTPNKGSIAAMGVCDVGYTSPLDVYCSAMYRAMYNVDSLKGKSAGTIMKNVLRSSSFYIDDQTIMQMNFHGDPQVKFYSPRRPDYEISGDHETRIDKPELKCFIKSFDSKKVTASADSFQIGIPIKNFGSITTKPFFIKVTRVVNGKTTVFNQVLYSAIDRVDTVFFIVRGNKGEFYGLNKFQIEVDPNDSIDEMKEDNNDATLDYFMSLSAVTCLFPKEYSIVHDQPITFVAQSATLLINARDYYFELDTNYNFTSGFKKTAIINSGSLVKWPNKLLYTDNNTDSIVYYWRVRYNNIASGEDTSWGTSSFIYIKGSPDGWSQSEAPQFVNDQQNGVYIDLADSTWKFATTSIDLAADIYGDLYRLPGDSLDIDYTNFKVGKPSYFPGFGFFDCGNPGTGSVSANNTDKITFKFNGIIASTLDKNSVIAKIGNCGLWSNPVLFYFPNGNGLEAWLNTIPEGDFLYLANAGDAKFDSWPASQMNNLITNFGALKTGLLNDKEPYLLLAKKRSTSPAIAPLLIAELHSNDLFAKLSFSYTLNGKYNNGSLVSTRIGPSTQWGTFYQRLYSQAQDKHLFKIQLEDKYGYLSDYNTLPLPFVKNSDNIDSLDISGIDAATYPYMRLVCMMYDSSAAQDPPQLNRWQVIYRKSPEGSMNPFAAGLQNYIISKKDEGAKVCMPYQFDNIADLSFQDSIYVTMSPKGNGSLQDTTFIVYKDTLNPGNNFSFVYCLNTKGLSGKISMRAFVNPNLQPEEYYTNNVIETDFEVVKDKIPPVIDVTFNGVHIMDGDLVSPSPLITITLNDNSKFLLMRDPNDIRVFFKSPGSDFVAIPQGDLIKVGQSPGGNNTFTIAYNPKNLPDGEYSIKVQGDDVNGNKSGEYYIVTFKVENASTISNFYPYPNPFSTSTRFVFTLSGHFIPDDLKIQIMTVTGKVVREIMKEELGNIHIGNNKTEYAWNGTDEYGDKLANGVYLYRIIIKNKGDNFEHRDTAGDKAFKKEFGKIYILR